MDRKGQAGAGLAVGAMIGIVTLIILVVVGLEISEAMREATLGTAYTKANVTSNYATDFNGTDRVVNFTVTRIASNSPGRLFVSYSNTSNVTNITVGSVAIGSLATATPQGFVVPASVLDTNVVRFAFQTGGREQISDINFTYTQYSGCTAYYDLCESANASVNMTDASFSILPILAVLVAASAVIGALILLGGRR